jgi:hypothetical protein
MVAIEEAEWHRHLGVLRNGQPPIAEPSPSALRRGEGAHLMLALGRSGRNLRLLRLLRLRPSAQHGHRTAV